jgi:hypothetical protein
MGKSKQQRAKEKKTKTNVPGFGWDAIAPKKAKSVVLDEPVKSVNDPREYRLVRLANGLEVLLINNKTFDDEDDEEYSDEEYDEEYGQKNTAAALSVGVGSYSDPKGVPGLAHFLEHMVFMGSKKYPDENDFDSFVTAHGGQSDAETGDEWTNFYFDISPKFFEKALDRFAQFFTSPLLKAEAAARELQSIESEFAGVLQDDDTRLMQVQCKCAKNGHPFGQFGWGNLKSLKTDPEKAGIVVRTELLRFHQQHYRAPSMRLVVLGYDSLDAMQKMVEKVFQNVGLCCLPCEPAPATTQAAVPPTPPSADLADPAAAAAAATPAVLPFEPASLAQVTCVVPVKQAHVLNLTWQLSPSLRKYRSSPLEYVAHLLGHEGPGSLFSALKQLRLADALYVDTTSQTSVFSLFQVEISLTANGIRQWALVISMVFRFLALMRSPGPQQWVHEERVQLGDIAFRFQEPEEPDETVESMATLMQPLYGIEPKDLLKAHCGEGAALGEWTDEAAEEVKKAMALLVPSGLRVDIRSPVFGSRHELEVGGEGEWEDEDEGGQMSREQEREGEQEREQPKRKRKKEVPYQAVAAVPYLCPQTEGEEGEAGEAAKEPKAEWQEEQWFSCPFYSLPIPPPLLQAWAEDWQEGSKESKSAEEDWLQTEEDWLQAAVRCEGASLFHWLEPNPLVANEFEVLPREGEGEGKEGEEEEEEEGPVPLPDCYNALALTGNTTGAVLPLWHRLSGWQYQSPRVHLSFVCLLPSAAADAAAAAAGGAAAGGGAAGAAAVSAGADGARSADESLARQCVYLELLVRLLEDSLNEFAYLGEEAGLTVTLQPHGSGHGIEIELGGFHEKVPLLVATVAEHLRLMRSEAQSIRSSTDSADAPPLLNSARLELVQETLVGELTNGLLEPLEHADELLRLLLRYSV